MLNTDPDPDPIRIQVFDDQKLKKNTAEEILIIIFPMKTVKAHLRTG
jgi:hypothetical protein